MKIALPNEQKEIQRYTDEDAVLRSEKLYGRAFQSPGAAKHISKICEMANLKPGSKILDIGCGLGGGSIFLANEYQADVVGIDIAELMVELATVRALEMRKSGSANFFVGNESSAFLEPASFDAVVSVDCFVYVKEKKRSFEKIRELLKPDGIFCLIDFCKGKETEDFKTYLDVSNYHLPDVNKYPEIVSSAGFELDKVENISDLTRQFLQDDLRKFLEKNDTDCDVMDEMKFYVDRWKQKIEMNADGFLQHIFVIAKPS